MTDEPMEMCYVLGDDGKPRPAKDPGEFAESVQDIDRRRVAVEFIGTALVSTCFVGVNFRLLGDGPPLLWETMIFRPHSNSLEGRFSSREEAEEGHRRVVERLRKEEEDDTGENRGAATGDS